MVNKNKEKVLRKLNFGCGSDILENYLNVDILKGEKIDKSFDFNKFPYPFSDNEFDEIYSSNVLEHLDDISKVINELHRIVKPNGLIRIIVPYYNCYGAYNDITHKHYFSHKAFEAFYLKNTGVNYFTNKVFELKEIKLIPTRIGKLLVFPLIQKITSFIFGQIIQTIDITLIVKK